jgi:hypothetical protein
MTGQVAIRHKDDEDAFARYVLNEYCAVAGVVPSLKQIQNDEYFWSAVEVRRAVKR